MENVCVGLILPIQCVFDTVNCAMASNRGIHPIERIWARYIRSIGFNHQISNITTRRSLFILVQLLYNLT